MAKGVIICGRRFSINSPRSARPNYQLWTTSRSMEDWDFCLQDWSAHFDIHNPEPYGTYPGIKLARASSWSFYKKVGPERTIYLTEKHPEVPASVAYPLADVLRTIPEAKGRLTTTTDMQIALALTQGFDHIILNGVGFYTDDESINLPGNAAAHRWQALHKGVLFWIGYCAGKGIRLDIEGPSVFAPAAKIYGFEATKEMILETVNG